MIDAFSLCRIIKLSFTPVDFLIVDSTNIAKELIHFQNGKYKIKIILVNTCLNITICITY